MLLIEGWLKLASGEFEQVREQGLQTDGIACHPVRRKLAVLSHIGVGSPVLAQQVAQGQSGRKVVERIRSRR